MQSYEQTVSYSVSFYLWSIHHNYMLDQVMQNLSASKCPLWFTLLSLRSVGEFRKTRHPRNVELNKVLEACFSGAGNSRFSETWNLRSLEFANVQSSGILIRWRGGVTNIRKPGISTVDGPNIGERPIRESVEDQVREFHVRAFMNQGRSKVKVVVPKSPGLECELVADL
jgi:hypothetical protein